MKAKRVHRKPIGAGGPVRVTNVGGRPEVSWRKIEYPPEKRAQELSIASTFVAALNTAGGSRWKLKSLSENDFDFEIICQEEKRYFELQEIVIPPKKRGPPYAGSEQVIRSPQFAETILAEINKKRVKYPTSLDRPLDLLIYVTHWRFLPSKAVLQLVASGLNSKSHPFGRVYFFEPLDGSEGHIEAIIPSGDLLKGFDPNQMRHHKYVNVEPVSGVPFTRGPQIGVRFDLSGEALRKLQQED